MQIRISVRHGTLSDDVQSKVVAKFEKLGHLFDRLTEIAVEIDLERRDEPLVDVKVSAEHKHDFVATHQSEDLMGSMDQVLHKLEQQLRKYKQKIQDHHRNPNVREMGIPGDAEPPSR